MLVNVYTETEVRVWMMLASDQDIDLELVEVDDVEHVGERPEWLDREIGDIGWDGIADFTSWRSGNAADAWHLGMRWATMGLTEGLAPDQPFLVVVGAPDYHRCSSYGEAEEWDVSFDVEIALVEPLEVTEAARRWGALVEQVTADCAGLKQAEAELVARVHTDVAAMYLRSSACAAPGQRMLYSDDFWRGVMLSVCSTHGNGRIVAQVHDADDDRARTRELLWAELGRRGVPITRAAFDRLQQRVW